MLVGDSHEPYRTGLARAIVSHRELELSYLTGSGLDAFEHMIENPPDVAVLDVRLAGLDGFGVTEFLRTRSPGHRIQIVLLSAVTDAAQNSRSRGMGVARYLSKEMPRMAICEALLEIGRSARNVPLAQSAPPKTIVTRRDQS